MMSFSVSMDGIARVGSDGVAVSGDYGGSECGIGGWAISMIEGVSVGKDAAVVMAGVGGIVSAGVGGILILLGIDNAGDVRAFTARVGDPGIDPDVAYRLDGERWVSAHLDPEQQ